MEAVQDVAIVDLQDGRVAVCGDWHGNLPWIGRAIAAAGRADVRTLLHVGDFGFWPGGTADLLALVEYWVPKSWERRAGPGVERVLVTPGNHEDWASLDELFAGAPGRAVRVSESVWVLPRGFRFSIGGRSFLSFGGAASIDYTHRVPFRSWWPSEMPSPEEVERAVAGGETEVLISHDVGHFITPRVATILTGPSGWSPAELAYSSSSRVLVHEVVQGARPLLQFHGHYHVRDSGVFDRDGLPPLRVEALNMDDQPGNLVLLDLDDLTVTDVEVR